MDTDGGGWTVIHSHGVRHPEEFRKGSESDKNYEIKSIFESVTDATKKLRLIPRLSKAENAVGQSGKQTGTRPGKSTSLVLERSLVQKDGMIFGSVWIIFLS